MNKLSIVVLISGNGSNLQAIIDAVANDCLPVNILAVISNKANAFGLERAKNAGIPTHVIDNKNYSTRESYDKALIDSLNTYLPDYVVLAGFMRILTIEFIQHYPMRIINIHPSLLPKYPGLNTHERVLKSGDKHHGVSIHYVTEALDAGPIIAQKSLAIQKNETPATLETRIHTLEHQLYPAVLRSLAKRE